MSTIAIYARSAPDEKYMPMNMNAGLQTLRKVMVTHYPDSNRDYLEKWCKELNGDNPGWHFEVRAV